MSREDNDAKTFYVTTPIYYVNDAPHIGHTYTTVAADAIARYQRLRGGTVLFATGTDEHAEKVRRAAEAAGLDPQGFTDRVVASYYDAWQRMKISYDRFIRTTEDIHKETVARVFGELMEKGDIYKDQYQGWYCVPCETYLREDELVDGRNCPDCGRPVEEMAQDAYFFKTSAYGEAVMRAIENRPELVQPDTRRNEVLSFIRHGLRDNCVSRLNTGWGVPVPGDEEHVVYVWFDALVNYLTVAGYGYDDERFARLWPPDVQLVGKDILPRFHATIWPAILMALGLELPRIIFGHGWWISASGDKISKSRGKVVDPQAEVELLIEESGCTTDVATDSVRYYLLREVPFGHDGTFSSEALLGRFNADLANDLGNLLNRTLPLVKRYLDGEIHEPGPGAGALAEVAQSAVTRAEQGYAELDFRAMLQATWELLAAANKFVDQRAPWDLYKTGKKVELAAVLYDILDSIRIAALLISPVMPTVSEEIWRQLGLDSMGVDMSWDDCEAGGMPPGAKVRRGRPIFPRIDMDLVRKRVAQEARQEEEEEQQDMITYDDFQRLDLRVARVLDADRIEGADKLLKLTVDVGEEQPRTLVAGIAQQFGPRELIGQHVVIVANLEPATIRGVQSQGMILAAGEKEPLALIVADRECEPGEKVR